ncbi:MAG: DUF1127 domain-containing protein [Geminicoccaceae bacterium]|nr:DUF1127 domain-containing protein [Geminicoccaceae bacterium]
MPLQRDLHHFGTLFSTATAFTSPIHETLTARRLYDAVPALELRPEPRRTFRRMVEALLTWHERIRQRQALAALTDHMLRDIGLSRADVSMEVDKPFWRP